MLESSGQDTTAGGLVTLVAPMQGTDLLALMKAPLAKFGVVCLVLVGSDGNEKYEEGQKLLG